MAPATAGAEIPLIFGVYAADKPSAMVDELRSTLNVVERELPERIGDRVRFKMQILRTYGEGIEALLERKVDVMRLGPVSYVKAKEQEPGLDILAVQVNNG